MSKQNGMVEWTLQQLKISPRMGKNLENMEKREAKEENEIATEN